MFVQMFVQKGYMINMERNIVESYNNIANNNNDEINLSSLPLAIKNFILDKEYSKDELKNTIINEIIEKDKLRTSIELTLGIIHDLNNSLIPITGSIHFLQENHILDKNMLKHLKTIETCAYDSINIINKANKATSYYKQGEDLKVFNVNEIILDAIDLTQYKWKVESSIKGNKIKIVTSLDSSNLIKGNSTEIREVFINLISNAVDAMPMGGNIEIKTRDYDDKVLIEVKDSGVGMNREVLNNIFNPFFTTKGKEGSGLGLSISYKNIKAHGGTINVESEINKGTKFIITLPISVETYNVPNNEEDKVIDFKGNILLIDDQSQIRNVIADMIKSVANCKIKSINGRNVEQELKRRKYEIIISDFSMPDIDGLTVAKIAKLLHQDTFFCLMTGWIGKFKKENLNNVDFIINKPVNKKRIKDIFIQYNKNMR